RDEITGDEAVACPALVRRRLDDAVPQLDRAEPRGGEETERRRHQTLDAPPTTIARTTSGVIGRRSTVFQPNGASASATAFAIAAGGAIAPPSPIPLMPPTDSGLGVSRCPYSIGGTSVAVGIR